MSGVIGGAGSKSGIIDETELDYEEGTWTPTFISSIGNNLSVSSGTFIGHYVKIGGTCKFSIYLFNATLAGTFNNSDNIWTLPFTNTGGRGRTTVMAQYGGQYFTTDVFGDIPASSTHMYIYKQAIPYAHAVWSATGGSGTYWYLSGQYHVEK